MTEKDFIPKPYKIFSDGGSVKWSSPSNIALIKYWGKKDNQIPANPSISFTLSDCKTITEVIYTPKTEKGFSFSVFFEGKRHDAFKPKIEMFFNRILAYLPFLESFHFDIHTENTFPHSSGIASSASGMSALALCMMSIENQLLEDSNTNTNSINQEFFYKKASFLARLGSGSACRSIEGEVVVWGSHKEFEGSTDLYGHKFQAKMHSNFHNYQDVILLVDKGEKQVSSTVGHNLMHNHPYANQRFEQARDNMSKLKQILISGDLKEFIALVESEALTLHAMMMTSNPYFILMRPNTLEIINKIWEYRKSEDSNICFTLDAGANVHLLFPEDEQEKVYEFIKNELVVFCQNGHYICDNVGKGAKQL